MNYLRIIVLVAFIACMAGACEYDHPQPFPEIVDTVSFSGDLIPYFDQSCNMAGCHNTGGEKPDLTGANAYNAIINSSPALIDLNDPEQSKFYRKINTGGSMEQYSTPSDNQKVLAWIKQGALDN